MFDKFANCFQKYLERNESIKPSIYIHPDKIETASCLWKYAQHKRTKTENAWDWKLSIEYYVDRAYFYFYLFNCKLNGAFCKLFTALKVF